MGTLFCNTSFSLPFSSTLLMLPLAELARLSAEEAQKYTQRKPNDPTIILALFYRACGTGKDADAAWSALYQQYYPLVLTWISRSRASTFDLLLREESAPSLVNAAFEKFARSLSPEKIHNFTLLPQVLAYFEQCTRCVLTDRVRTCLSHRFQRQSHALSWEDLRDAPSEPLSEEVADQVEHQCFAAHFWTVVNSSLHDDQERLFVYLTYQKGMKPQDICHAYPTLYATLDDVYRLKRKIVERLSRFTPLSQLLADYDVPLHAHARQRRKEAS